MRDALACLACIACLACDAPYELACGGDADCARGTCVNGLCLDGDAGEGEGDAAEGEGDAAEGEGDAAEGEGDAAEGEGDAGEGEGDVGEGEGEGDAGEGEGEGEGDAVCADVPGAVVQGAFGNHCYAGFLDNESWTQAAFRCAALGGIPAVPSSDAEVGFLETTMLDPGADPYVGVVDIGNETAFVSITGEPFFGALLGGEPNNSNGIEHCLDIGLLQNGDVGYNDLPCGFAFFNFEINSSTLCEMPLGPSFCGDGTFEPGLGEACDDGNNVDGDGCPADCSGPVVATPVVYELREGRLLMGFNQLQVTFDVARRRCLDIGGDLAIPTDQIENDELLDIANRIGASIWIGYVDGRGGVEAGTDPTLFRRVDDDTLIGSGFQHFAGGEPSNGNGIEDCVELRSGTGEWNDLVCDQRNRAFVCEVFPN